MLVLDFTNQRKTSNSKKGFFGSWNNLFGDRGAYNTELNDIDDDDSGESNRFLLNAKSTKGSQSLAGYFNALGKLNRKTKWVFGNEDKIINIDSMTLEVEDDDYNDFDYSNHFIDNIFSLGNGLNYFSMELEFEDNKYSKMQASVKRRLRQKGYKATILGGSGMDHIDVDFDRSSDVNWNSKSTIVANTNGGKDTIEIWADFSLSARINSGNGSDLISLEEANSSFVNAGNGSDTMILGRSRPYEMSELRAAKKIKDIVIGGSGRDQFVFNQRPGVSAYALNGKDDFCVLKDFQSMDEIIFHGNEELRIDSKNGKIKLAATGAYKAQFVGFTARLYADNDLIAYISGSEPSLSDISQVALTAFDS